MSNPPSHSRRDFLKALGLGVAVPVLPSFSKMACAFSANRPPNFIVIFCDDLGYGDLGCFGSTVHRTPSIDRMASEGTRFTSFYVTSGVCTPSRASLMTGCYPRRVNMHINAEGRQVLFPVAKKGLHPDEITLAELLKSRGYATACIGKWHLGDQPEFLPTRQGFDTYLGIPYSNDMRERVGWKNPPLPLLRNETVIEAPVGQNTLTKRYTEEAVKFIYKNKENPFFLYLPHAMPHNPVHASEAFRGKSANGGYGDAVEELDWSTGQILEVLRDSGIDEHTLVVFTSDNGAAKRWGGSNAPLAGWKGSTMEGGMRVPCVLWWPGEIPAGATGDALTTTMDLYPTFGHLAGANLPDDRIIDGKNIWSLMAGKEIRSPHEAFYYYRKQQLQAVRSGEWKLHLPLEAKQHDWRGGTHESPLQLYDLKADRGETTDVSGDHPGVVKRLMALAERARQDLGDDMHPGENQRPPGLVVTPNPLVVGGRL